MQPLEGKRALVTGASRGIGRAIALRLAADGAEVVINYLNNAAAAKEVVDHIASAGGRATAFAADIGDVGAVRVLADSVHDRHGPIDILVHNAGITLGHPRLAESSEDQFDTMFNLSAKGPWFLTQAVSRHMPANGRIICISSASTQRKIAGLGLYTGARSALEAFARVWAAELAPRGITVNTVSPGAVETELFAKNSDEFRAHLLKLIPMGRFGQPGDIADICALIARKDARWLTGLNIAATGGA